jgi:ADP-heptose:LPS heptosyltransferase
MIGRAKQPAGPVPAPADAKKVLVIKLGALGDFIQALPSAKAIREYHFGARITLLTTEPFQTFAQACPYFDVIEADGRPKEPRQIAQLLTRIRAQKFDMVYDLQTSGRTTNYYHGLKPWPPRWSGIAPGCSHPQNNPDRTYLHTLDRLADQLHAAGLGPPEGYPIGAAPLPDLSWIRTALRDPPRLQPEYFGFKPPFVLIMPGASPHRPDKRWREDRFAELAQKIAARGVTPVLIGALAEREAANVVAKAEPRAKNLISRTDLFQIACLAEHAAAAVGNDTGPMHIAAAAGARCLVLFSQESDPERVAPRGRNGVMTMLAPNLAELPVADVDRALGNLGAYGAIVRA